MKNFFPYGCSAYIAGDQARDIDVKDYRYSGKERDEFTGLYYYGYRYYASWMGRWLSPDPIGHEDSLNLYLFVHNNPENKEDEEGLQTGGGSRPRRSSGSRGSTAAPMTFPAQFAVTTSEGTTTVTFNSRAEFDRFISEWRRAHPKGHVTIRTGQGPDNPPPPPTGDEQENAPGVSSDEGAGSGASEGGDEDGSASAGDGAGDIGAGAGSGATGSGIGAGTTGNGIGSGGTTGNGTGSGGTVGTGTGAGSGTGTLGNGTGGNGSGGGGTGGSGTGGTGGHGTGTGTGARRTGPRRESMRGAREGGTGTHPVDPNAPYSLDGDPNAPASTGQGQGPGNGTGASQPGDPNGDPNGSPNGTPGGTGQPPEELEWWQTALIIAAVVVVTVALTIATAGIATAVFGAAAASSLGGMLAIGAVSGFAAGFAGDLTSQSMTLAFQGREVLPNLNWGHAVEAGVVGAAVGVLTAGAGAALASATKGTIAAASAARVAGTATLSQRALLSAETAFNNSAAFRAVVRSGRGALIGSFGGSASEAGSQLIRNGRITDGSAVLTAGAQGLAFGAVLDAGLGHIGDRARAAAPRGAPPPTETNSPAPRPRPLERVGGGEVSETRAGPAGSGVMDRVTSRTDASGVRRLDAVTGRLERSHLDLEGTGTTAAARRAAQAEHSALINGNDGNVFQAGHARDNRFGGRGGLDNTFPQWGFMNMGQFNQFVGRVAGLVESSAPTDRIYFSVQPRYASPSATVPSQVVYFLRINGRTAIRAIFSNVPGRNYVRFF